MKGSFLNNNRKQELAGEMHASSDQVGLEQIRPQLDSEDFNSPQDS